MTTNRRDFLKKSLAGIAAGLTVPAIAVGQDLSYLKTTFSALNGVDVSYIRQRGSDNIEFVVNYGNGSYAFYHYRLDPNSDNPCLGDTAWHLAYGREPVYIYDSGNRKVGEIKKISTSLD